MGQGISYPHNQSPTDDDQLLGIDDPDGTWTIQRFSVSGLLQSVRDRLDALELALRENQIYPGEIVFTTNGQTFEPTIVLNGEATIEWTFSDGSTSNSATPSVDFGSSAVRLQRLKVTPWENLYRLNVGYQREDGGHSTDELGNPFEMVDAQPVTNIANLKLVQDTLVYLCGCHCPITSLNVRDFTALHTLEFYGCGASLASVDIYGTSNLRRACFEGSYVGFLDFSASPLMEDVRGSNCQLTEIRWGTTGQYLWHMCVRENSAYLDPSTWPSMNQFPVLQDMWISGNGITGDMVANSTVVGSAWLYNNDFSTIDMTNTTANSITAQGNTNCTSITIDGCPGLATMNAYNCALTQANVDYILATLDANGLSGGTVDLSGGNNSPPSGAGLTSIANLEGKGWTCTYNAPVAPTLSSVTIGADGTTWTMVFSEAVQIGTGGSGGFAVTMTNAGAIALTYSSGDGTDTLVFTGDTTVEAGDTVASGLDYTQPGDGIENTAGYDLATLTGASVTNNSVAGPPALISATIESDGTTWTLLFSKEVQIGSGGNGGFAVTMAAAGAVTLTYSSGDGTNTLVYNGDVTVEQLDTPSSGLDYTQPGDGIEAISDGADLATFTGASVTNSSSQGGVPIALESFDSQAWDDVSAENISWNAGDTVVVFVGCWSGTAANFSVADTDGDTYTPIANSLVDGSASLGWFYQRKDAAGSGTVTLSGQDSNASIRIYVLSGIASVSPVDFAVTVASGLVSPAFSTSEGNVIVLMGYHHDGSTPTSRTITPATMTWDNNDLGAPSRPCAHEILDTTVTGQTITVTPDAGDGYAMSVIGLIGEVQGPDVQHPVLQSATIGADGTTWTLVFDEIVTIGAGGSGGLAVTMANAGVVGLTYSSGDGTDTLVYAGDVTVNAGDTVSSGLDYTQPGDGIEDAVGNDLISFSSASVSNNSTTGPPTLVSASIGTDGLTWSFEFNKAVTIGAGGNGGFAVTMTTAGAINLTYSSGDGTTTLAYTGDTQVTPGDTVSSGLDYTQPGDGIESNSGGEDLASFTGASVTNNAASGRLDYTTSDENPNIELVVTGTPTITWYLSDGTVLANDATTPGQNSTSTGEQSHYVIVDPPSAVTRINRNNTNLLDVDGCGNFPALNYMYFYPWSMARHIDLSGCSAMRQWHLAGGTLTSAEADQALADQAAALAQFADGSLTGDFYFCNGRSAASDADYNAISAKGITMQFT